MAFTTPEDEKKIKAYLSGCLTQYSDADASILSDYIVALLQKNGDLPSLKKECNKELSAFMNTKTETFVEELFVFLRTLVTGNDTKKNSKIIQPRRRVEIQRSNDDTNLVVAMNLNNKNNDNKNNNESNVESLISNPAKDFDIPSNELKNNKKSDKTSSDDDSDINSDRNNAGSSRERRRHRQRRYHSRKRRHYNNNSNNNGSNINTNNGIENVNVEVLGKLLTMISQASQPSLQVTPNPTTIYPKLIPTNNNVKANLLNKRLDELNNFSLPYKKHSKNIPNIRRNRKRTYTNMNNTNNISNNSINNNDNNSSPNSINNNTSGNVIKKRRKETADNEKRQLFISNIPSELNDVMKLTSYFGQFGEIENIQVHRNMGKAYIQYSKHDDAVVALENPEAILQNNDIKVNWAHYNRPDFDKKARYKFGENKEQYISNDDNMNDDSGTGINTGNNNINSVGKYSHNYNRKYRGGYAGSTYNKARKYLNYKTNPKQLTWISDE